jgi:hypothetical protein
VSPLAILALLLALSCAGNAWQYHEHTVDSVKFGTTQQLADDTKAAAQACSDGVDKLQGQSAATRTAIIAAVQGEGARIKGLQHDALEAIKARPDDPKDLCGSIERYLKAQIAKERGVK